MTYNNSVIVKKDNIINSFDNVDNINNDNILYSQNVINNFIAFLDVSPLSVRSYISGVKRFFAFMFENGINTPNSDDVITFKKSLLDTGHKPATVALYLAAIKRFFAWTEQSGIYKNIARDVKAPKIDRGHKKDCFSGTQIKSILANMPRTNIEGLRNYAMFALMINCGLRTIELARANIEDLRTSGDCTLLYIQGKGRTSKTDFVKLSPQVEQAIRAYLKARGNVNESAPLFVSHSRRNSGQRLTTRTISGVAKKAMINAGYQSARLTAHSLRHTAITLALLKGLALADVQAFARHTSINTTMIYNHSVNRMTSQCEAVIADAIF